MDTDHTVADYQGRRRPDPVAGRTRHPVRRVAPARSRGPIPHPVLRRRIRMSALPLLTPLRHVTTDVLEVAYYETGSDDGDTVVLLHGFPYDIHSYVDVAPLLAESGFHVVVPH